MTAPPGFRLKKCRIYWNMLIRLTQLPDKLLFSAPKKRCHCEEAVRRGNPPVLPPVIPSERSESRDLACSFTFQLRSVRRSFDSLRSLRMTAWVEGWGLGGKSGGLPRHLSALARNDSIFRVRTRKQQFIVFLSISRSHWRFSRIRECPGSRPGYWRRSPPVQ